MATRLVRLARSAAAKSPETISGVSAGGVVSG